MLPDIQFSFRLDPNSHKEAVPLYWDLFTLLAEKKPQVDPGDTLQAFWTEATGWKVQIERQPRVEELI